MASLSFFHVFPARNSIQIETDSRISSMNLAARMLYLKSRNILRSKYFHVHIMNRKTRFQQALLMGIANPFRCMT
jgi:hypothetical protein